MDGETFVKFWSNFLNLFASRIKSNLHANEAEWEQICQPCPIPEQYVSDAEILYY